MAQKEKVWDGFRWVEVEDGEGGSSSRPFGGGQKAPRGAYGEAVKEKQEAQRRLTQLQRDMLAMRSNYSRLLFHERKRQEVFQMRKEHEIVTGRAHVGELSRAKPATEDDLAELARRLNAWLQEQYVTDIKYKSGQSQLTVDDLNRRYLSIFREMDTDDSGRIDYNEFTEMLRAKLQIRPPKRTRRRGESREEARESDRKEHVQYLMGLWKALDDDGSGKLRGYITLGEFFSFMRSGATPRRSRVQGDAEGDAEGTEGGGVVGEGGAGSGGGGGEAPIGWKERLLAARREAAEDLKKAKRAGGAESAAALEAWRAEMAAVEPASDSLLAAVASELLGASAFSPVAGGSWYSIFKAMDTDGSGRVTWIEFFAVCKRHGLVPASRPQPPRMAVRTAEDELPRIVTGERQQTADTMWTGERQLTSDTTTKPPEPMGRGGKGGARRRLVDGTRVGINVLRSVWRRLDTQLSGTLTVADVAAFLRHSGGGAQEEEGEEGAEDTSSRSQANDGAQARRWAAREVNDATFYEQRATKAAKASGIRMKHEADRLEGIAQDSPDSPKLLVRFLFRSPTPSPPPLPS